MAETGGAAEAADPDLVALLIALKRRGYRFITPTPTTHERVIARPGRSRAADVRDALGWNLPFGPEVLDAELEVLLRQAGALQDENGLRRARLRVASLDDWLFLHSPFPTTQRDSVFFGPDSYRFADLIRTETAQLALADGARIVDIGGGTGVGAILAASLFPAAEIAMTEINREALRLARANIAAAGFRIRPLESATLDPIEGRIDLALANPPYIADEAKRAYRDGGGLLGAETSLQMARMAAERLAPGGRLILYTGSAIVRGEDSLRELLSALAGRHGLSLRYRELDPDVFGEELDRPAYAEVERIALVAAVLDRPA